MKIFQKINLPGGTNQLGISLLFLVLMISGCGGSSGLVQNYEDLNQVVNTREFEVQHTWAIPQTGSRIDLMGNPNYIRFKGDSVEVMLPYFGVRHSGGNYGGGEGGIRYEGPLKDLQIEENLNEEQIIVEFEGEHDGENLNFYITLFSNGNAHTTVNPSERSSISYQGKIEELP